MLYFELSKKILRYYIVKISKRSVILDGKKDKLLFLENCKFMKSCVIVKGSILQPIIINLTPFVFNPFYWNTKINKQCIIQTPPLVVIERSLLRNGILKGNIVLKLRFFTNFLNEIEEKALKNYKDNFIDKIDEYIVENYSHNEYYSILNYDNDYEILEFVVKNNWYDLYKLCMGDKVVVKYEMVGIEIIKKKMKVKFNLISIDKV